MASHPPLQVEDQTDEDFFDKLVDDDFSGPQSGPELFRGPESNEAKTFANLSLGKVGNDAPEDSIMGVKAKGEEIKLISADATVAPVDAYVNDRNSLAPSISSGPSNVVESNDDIIGMLELTPDSGVHHCSESAAPCVKEVQWSAFNPDAPQSSANGFGSYSDVFAEFGDGSREFPKNVEENLTDKVNEVSGHDESKSNGLINSSSSEQCQDGQDYAAGLAGIENAQDLSSTQYWENLYPGWKYDPNSGQWFQVDGYDAAANAQEGLNGSAGGGWAGSDGISEALYLQQTIHCVAGTVAESGTTESVSNTNQVLQGSNEYPEHMVLDPQYPGWYYDTIGQEWRMLETYSSALQQTVESEIQQNQNHFDSATAFSHNHDHGMHVQYGKANNLALQGPGNRGQENDYSESYGNYNLRSLNTWQPESVPKTQTTSYYSGKQQLDNFYRSNASINSHINQKMSYNSVGTELLHNQANLMNDNANEITGLQSYIPSSSFSQRYGQSKMGCNEQAPIPYDYYGNQPGNPSQKSQESGHQLSSVSSIGRSSAGRPPHALVTFGFGGKLIIVRDSGPFRNSPYGSQDVGGSISVHNLMEVVTQKTDASGVRGGDCNYYRSLCQHSFPGPLVSGSVGNKELNKWIDERIANCDAPGMEYRKGEALRLLLSLLKISFQHYGKLRSPFGTDAATRENEIPESAIAKIFASSKRHSGQLNADGSGAHCLRNFPLEGQIQATAADVQSLLVSGRTMEALHCAQEGQLWGPALVLASQLGDQFFVDTVKQMALRQLVAGSPMRTLCLLIAGQPADVFSADAASSNGFPGVANMPQQSDQLGVNLMLDDWEENLAVITANRTKDDELVIIHLGDCLWKDRSEIIAAHICYLVAEANFEAYSDTARLCLLGADHWKFPRTFVTPEAIQRTELYEYSKVLGNSQYMLLALQPYKLCYAHMLAEVGKVSDALKYCQAISKCLKAGRGGPEADMWKQLGLSLEDRLRAHQQGGFTANFARTKIVGKLLNLFDSTAHRVVGGLPPMAPSTSQTYAQENGHFHQMMGPKVSSSQSTMAMSSLLPSASVETISEWTTDGNKKVIHNRSISEPDFSRTPRQDEAASNSQGKGSSGSSRFTRFGFGSQFLQKTVELVLKRSDKQAKLGEKNKFFYDEKLKRWVEEGAEPPSEEAALPPPPITSSFPNGTSGYSLKTAIKNEGPFSDRRQHSVNQTLPECSSGIPSIAPSSNQFFAHGRLAVQSRYVDTFNHPANLFHSPSVPAVKSAGGVNPNFFIPAPEVSSEGAVEACSESVRKSASAINEHTSTSSMFDSFQSLGHSSSMVTQRFSSMGDIQNQGVMTQVNGSESLHGRTASWSGNLNHTLSPPKKDAAKTSLEEEIYMPGDPLLMQLQRNGSGIGEDLHEVEL